MQEILLSSALPWALFGFAVVAALSALIRAYRRGDVRGMVASILVPAVVFGAAGLVLIVQLEGLRASRQLLQKAEYHRGLADLYLSGAHDALRGGGEVGLEAGIAMMQVSQAADAMATQAVIAEAQTKLTSSMAVLTTVLVLATVYLAWQARLQHRRQAPGEPERPVFQPQIVLVVPRRFRRVRRWLRPESSDVEQIRL